MMTLLGILLGVIVGCSVGGLLLRSLIAWEAAQDRKRGNEVTEEELNCAKRLGVGLMLGESLLLGTVAGVMAPSDGLVVTLITVLAASVIFSLLVGVATLVVVQD